MCTIVKNYFENLYHLKLEIAVVNEEGTLECVIVRETGLYRQLYLNGNSCCWLIASSVLSMPDKLVDTFLNKHNYIGHGNRCT